MNFDLTRCSNSIFSKFICLICSIKVPIDFFGVMTNQSNQYQSIVFLASQSWLYQSSRNCFWYWLHWIFKLHILRSYRLGFSHQRVSRKLYSCSGGFGWGVFFHSCIKILMSGNALKVLVMKNIIFQTKVFPLGEVWFLQSRSHSTKIVFELTFSLKRCRVSSLQQKPDGAKVSKDAMHFDLCRYSKSNFSEVLICCIKAPIDLYGVLTNQSIEK